MVNAWIAEYKAIGFDERGYPVQAGEEARVAEQVVTFTTSSTQSTALNALTQLVVIHVDADCHFKFGADPSASKTSGGSPLMAQNETRYYGVARNSGLKIAFIDDS